VTHGGALLGAASVLRTQGDIDGALDRYDKATIFWTLGDRRQLNLVLHNRAAVLMDRGEFRAALPVFESIEASARDADDLAAAAGALTNQGIVLFHLGDPARAVNRHEQSEDFFREVDQREELAACLLNKGTALRGVGQLDEAVSCFHEAEDLYRGLGDRRGAAHAVLNAATVDSDRNANLAAMLGLESAARVFREIGDLPGLAVTLGNILKLLPDNRLDTTVEKSTEVIGIWRTIGNRSNSPSRSSATAYCSSGGIGSRPPRRR
jgi:tetratricopeptide (TPR) repeat protein